MLYKACTWHLWIFRLTEQIAVAVSNYYTIPAIPQLIFLFERCCQTTCSQQHWNSNLVEVSLKNSILIWAFFEKNHPFFKPSLSMKILSINEKYLTPVIKKLLCNFLRDLSNKVHLKIISKFFNKVINRQYFFKWTCF